jgi:hypothetical protein
MAEEDRIEPIKLKMSGLLDRQSVKLLAGTFYSNEVTDAANRTDFNVATIIYASV